MITGLLIAPQRSHWVLATKLANPMGPGPNALRLDPTPFGALLGHARNPLSR